MQASIGETDWVEGSGGNYKRRRRRHRWEQLGNRLGGKHRRQEQVNEGV